MTDSSPKNKYGKSDFEENARMHPEHSFLDSEAKSLEQRSESQAAIDPRIAVLPMFMQSQVRALEGISYYHGLMARDETEKIMKRSGDFLLRATDNRIGQFEFILSLYNHRRLHSHFTILSDNNEVQTTWWLMVDKQRTFESVQALLLYYQQHDLGDGFKLTRGISKGTHMISHKRIDTGAMLGSGNYSEVFRGRLELENNWAQVALKNSKLLNALVDESQNPNAHNVKMEMIKEAHTMSQLRHPNTTQLFGIAIDRLPVLIVVEFCQGGSLHSHLLKNGVKISNRERLLYISDMLAGLAYIHGMGITHRDLACRNILIDASGFLKLSDFGLGVRCRRSDNLFSKTGAQCPARWMAPETMTKSRYSFNRQTDTYSMGITIWEMYNNGLRPYAELDNVEAMIEVKRGRRLELPNGVGVFMETFYAKMTALDVNLRVMSDMAHQTFQEHVIREKLLTLENITLNTIKGVNRIRIYHNEAFVPQVVLFDNDGKNLGYHDAPSDMLVKEKVK